MLAATCAMAAPPRVAIDVGTIVECADVTPPAYASDRSQERIVEARIRFSVLLQAGREADLEQLQVTVVSPERRMRVVDFQPRTALASELAGDVEICNSNDTTQSLNASLGGVISGDHGPAHVQASPAAGVGVTQIRGSKETFHRLSPKIAVLASGTTNAEHGVFFKFRHSSQVALEGSREVTVRFLVPHEWRGDWVRLDAEMLGRHRNYLGEKIEPCGQTQVYLGLYDAGNAVAHQAAMAVASAQASNEVPAGHGTTVAAQRHTVNKPVMSSDKANAESRKQQEWFALPSVFKLCNQERTAVITDEPTALSIALDDLAALAGESAAAGTR
ncbi:MAG TPA: hypothetical protein VGN12_22995 [Pirellulales bacterium]|jgi:hypothetical protein